MQLEGMRTEVRELKGTIEKKRQAVNDGGIQAISDKASAIKKVQMKARKTLKGHQGKVYAMHWSADSKHLVSASQDGKLLIWDTYTTNKMNAITLKSSWVMTCAFAPSGNLVASGGLDNMCTIYNLDTKDGVPKAMRMLNDHNGFLSCCRFLDDKRILTGSGDTTCALWDLETGMKTVDCRGHHGDVISISFLEEHNMLITSSGDKSVKLWDLRTGICNQTFEGHLADVNAVMLFPSGLAFGTASDDTSCRLFDIRSDQEVMMYHNESSPFPGTSVVISKSGRLLIAGYDDFNSIIWDVLTGTKAGALAGHENRVSCLGMTECGNAIATGSWDASLRVWN